MAAVTFALLGVADAPLLSDIALRAYRDHYLDYWYDRGEWYMNRCFTPAQLATELADSNARYFLILLQQNPVGFIKINLDKALPDSGQSAADGLELERIYLFQEAMGHGIGQQAIEFVEKLARERHKHTIWLKAMDTSAAVGFYNRMGFEGYDTLRLDFSQMKPELRGMVILRKLTPGH